jgi:hypothetical protein
LLADESTDEANRTQFAILIRFLQNGSIDYHFLGTVNVKRADSASLMNAISPFLISKDTEIKRLVFIGV